MMGRGPGWAPLVFPAIALTVLLVAALTVTFALRSAGQGGRLRPRRPDHRDSGSRRTAPAREEPLVLLKERYARGEIDHAEFVRILDVLLDEGP